MKNMLLVILPLIEDEKKIERNKVLEAFTVINQIQE